jgi:hypothetical protein
MGVGVAFVVVTIIIEVLIASTFLPLTYLP